MQTDANAWCQELLLHTVMSPSTWGSGVTVGESAASVSTGNTLYSAQGRTWKGRETRRKTNVYETPEFLRKFCVWIFVYFRGINKKKTKNGDTARALPVSCVIRRESHTFAAAKVSAQTSPKVGSITPSCSLDPSSQQGAGTPRRAFLTPPIRLTSRERAGAEEKQAWLLYQYKENAMEHALMVHQLGPLGGERARLMVMNVLFGYNCARPPNPRETWLGPGLRGAVTGAATGWQQRTIPPVCFLYLSFTNKWIK